MNGKTNLDTVKGPRVQFFLKPSYGGLDLPQKHGIQRNDEKSSHGECPETVGSRSYWFCVGFEVLGGILLKQESTSL